MPCGPFRGGSRAQVLNMFRKAELLTRADSKVVQLACADDKVRLRRRFLPLPVNREQRPSPLLSQTPTD